MECESEGVSPSYSQITKTSRRSGYCQAQENTTSTLHNCVANHPFSQHHRVVYYHSRIPQIMASSLNEENHICDTQIPTNESRGENSKKQTTLESNHRCLCPRSQTRQRNPLFNPQSWRNFSFLLLTFLVIILSPHRTLAQSPTWEAQPQNTDVPENGRAVLRCQIRNLGDSKIAWLRENTNFFVDGDRWVAPTRFNVSKVSEGTIGGYDLVLNGANREDDADYTCQLQSQTLIATAHLTVLVKPSIPSITKSRSDLSEKDEVTFTCSTSEGNPPPVIRWYRKTDQSDQWEELTGAVTTPPVSKFNTSRSVLVRMLNRSDHKAHLRCTATNSAVTNPPESFITLDVKYAPVVTITPSDAAGTQLVVEEGRNATLTCHVDSNPYTSARKWEKDGVQIPEPNYRAVAKEDSGNYTCVATNVIRSTRTWITLDVQYGPVVTVTAPSITSDHKLYVSEGVKVNMSCSVQANPPVTTVQWKDSLNSPVSWHHHYVIGDVSRQHAGIFTCLAENVLKPTLSDDVIPKQGTQEVELVVQYPPGKANITGPRYVLVGQEAVLNCHVADKGVPAASIEWTQLGDPQNAVISRQGELRFAPARLADNADYICKPTNSINDGEPDTFRLVVNESPAWLPGGELPPSQTVNVTQRGALMAQCQARGRPLPRVRWYLDDTPVNDMGDHLFTVETEHVPLDTHSFLVTTTLLWRGRGRDRVNRLRRADSGRYRCQFTNDHGELHSDMRLTVQYMPVLNVTADKVATDMNQSAVLSCSSHAVPAPRFTWYNKSTPLVASSRVTMGTEVVGGEFPHRAYLNISDVTAEDLGEYKCVGVNDLGFAEKYIYLTVKTTPDAPTNLQVLSKTWESVELSWTEGFDGGYRPTYYVFYMSARHNNTRVKVIPTANRFNVTGLYPSLTYTFKVFGENQLGGGDYSANISTVTEAHPIEPPTEVFYHLVKRTLTFRSPSTHYCVRIEVSPDGAGWNRYAECAPPSGSVKIRDGVPVTDVRIALCLQRRKEICSSTTKAFPVQPPPDDLSVETIIIVACVCGTVVLVLLCILIFLCIRRHQARRKDYENDPNAQRAAQATGGAAGNKKFSGIDNPSLDQTDVVDLDDRSRGRVFANDTSSRQNNANYVMFDRRKAQNGQASNGYPAMNGGPSWNRANGNMPNEPPPDYREVERDGTTESEYIAMHKGRSRNKSDTPDGHDSGYVPDHMKEPDSGVSTPDPSKPKKVIYEVIV